jgi:HEAT repeat protein
MIEKARFFLPDVAFAKLREWANAKNYNIRFATDLAKQEILHCSPANVKKYLNGHYPLTGSEAAHVRDKLGISEDDLDRITEVRAKNLPTLIEAFFKQLEIRGIASAIAFLPRKGEDVDVNEFCVPARVIPEEEWSYLIQRHRRNCESPDDREETLLARGAAGVNLNGWLRRAYRKVAIKGEPGEGKTTALWLYAGELCRRWLAALPHAASLKSKAAPLLPLVLPLKKVPEIGTPSEDVTELAIDHLVSLAWLEPAFKGQMKGWLRRKVELGEFILLLDGLDELPETRTEWLKAELTRLAGISVVLTSRYHAEPGQVMGTYKTLRMVSLRWWVIDQFITKYFSGQRDGIRLANELRSTLRLAPGLRQLAQNPLLLAATCFLKAEDESGALPSTRTGVLEAALRTLLRRGDARRTHVVARGLRDEQKIEVLAEAAWYFQRESVWPMTEIGLLKVIDKVRTAITHDPPQDAQALLREFEEDGVLVRRGAGPYDFLLRRFQEYCLARRIARMGEVEADTGIPFQVRIRGRAEKWGREKLWSNFRPLNQPRWAGVWPLVAGCIGENGSFIEALSKEWETHEDLVQSRLRLLVSAMGEFLGANRMNTTIVSRWRVLTERVADAVLDLASEEPLTGDLPESWRRSLAQLPPELVVPRLWARFKRGPSHLQHASSYALALAEVGTRDACRLLVSMVEDETIDEAVRASAATGLGWIGDEEARNLLLRCLKDTAGCSRVLHFGCIAGLSYVGDELSRQALSRLISERACAEARHQCLECCERLFGPEIEEEVLGLLSRVARNWPSVTTDVADADETMQQCAGILGRIGGPGTARRMVKLLTLPLSGHAKRRICAAVAETGDDESRRTLRRTVLDPQSDRELVYYSVAALIRVGDEELLPKLLEACADGACDERIRITAAEACALCATSAAVRFLAGRLIKDASPKVKLEAARGLARQGDPLAVTAMKESLELELPSEVRSECERGLALMGDADAQNSMVQSAKDRDAKPDYRYAALRTLAQCSGETPRSVLRELYEDTSESTAIRLRCLDALATIQREQGWRPLRAGGWDAP